MIKNYDKIIIEQNEMFKYALQNPEKRNEIFKSLLNNPNLLPRLKTQILNQIASQKNVNEEGKERYGYKPRFE